MEAFGIDQGLVLAEANEDAVERAGRRVAIRSLAEWLLDGRRG